MLKTAAITLDPHNSVESVPAKLNVLGVGVSTTSYEEVSAVCARWISQRPGGCARYICVTSVHGVMEARRDERVRRALNGADIVTPDGMPLVWALRSFGAASQQRVYGPNLMLALCGNAEKCGHRIFLYGGRPDTLETLEQSLRRRFPQLVIAGAYSPPFRPLTAEEDEQVYHMLREARADLIFVGISTPKQDLWMAEHARRMPGAVLIGVGAAFDFHAGRVPQAPGWMQARGLEWVYRLTKEPRRLWRRYVLVTPWFLPCWAMQKLSYIMHDVACGRSERRLQSPIH
jgi:N-acetylglucosaminyldiphosphoundecaprenol N-acetyl-beta-D-mannosaminyltransferase